MERSTVNRDLKSTTKNGTNGCICFPDAVLKAPRKAEMGFDFFCVKCVIMLMIQSICSKQTSTQKSAVNSVPDCA